MKHRKKIFVLGMALLAACSSGQTTPQINAVQATTSPRAQPVNDSVPPAMTPTDALPAISPTPKPPLEKGSWMDLPVVPAGISDGMQNLYQQGIAQGNDPTHFSIIGDCQNVSTYFLSAFDHPEEYSLGSEYAYLQPTIDYYQGSFSRVSLAVRGGFNAAAVISPLRADPQACNPNESPLDCELRTWRPSIVVVSMETWWSEKPAEEYDKYMRRVLDRIIETGAVPIITTKADNLEGNHAINATIAQLAYEYDIPMWNFWAAVQPLPDHGLSPDGFHLTFARNFFDDPKRMKNAWPWRNLTALQSIHAVQLELSNQR